MYQHWQMTLPLLLSVYYRYYRSSPVPVPPTSGHQDIRSTAPVRSTSLWWFRGVVEFVGWDPPLDWIFGMGSLLLGSAVVGSLLRSVAAKLSSQSPRPIPAGICRWWVGRGLAGEIKIFKNVILAHYLDYSWFLHIFKSSDIKTKCLINWITHLRLH